MPELAISAEKVGFLIEKAREFDVKDAASDLNAGSNGSDDDMIDVLEVDGHDPVVREITEFIDALTEDEQIDLVALVRLGRGDGSIEEWNDLRREAAEGRNGRTAPRDEDFLPALHALQQLRKMRLGFVGTDGSHTLCSCASIS